MSTGTWSPSWPKKLASVNNSTKMASPSKEKKTKKKKRWLQRLVLLFEIQRLHVQMYKLDE